eukprot:TRINITY_DN4405_c0_g1_i1.p1 TRINITY_DN4405_c0_g1~~TRINITY_DN4405_c0_g1_i1.p1  ORF type:complete len:134 (-),score=28.82 TRINITY_DN4405_c0_g1_i1:412-813(-)
MNLKMRVPLLLFSVLFLSIYLIEGKKGTTDKPDWAKKDIRDFSDADMERLLDQWEEDEEPLPLDELPEGDPRRPQPKIDISNAGNDPEGILKASKKRQILDGLCPRQRIPEQGGNPGSHEPLANGSLEQSHTG